MTWCGATEGCPGDVANAGMRIKWMGCLEEQYPPMTHIFAHDIGVIGGMEERYPRTPVTMSNV